MEIHKLRIWIALVISVGFINCSSQRQLGSKPEIIAYRFPDKVEQLLLKEIRGNQKEYCCLLIEQKNNGKEISLVNKSNYYHKNTSYKALLGGKYYPISFPQFDIKFGVVEDAKKLLLRKIKSKDSKGFLTNQSYPMYHKVYRIVLDSNSNIKSAGYVY